MHLKDADGIMANSEDPELIIIIVFLINVQV